MEVCGNDFLIPIPSHSPVIFQFPFPFPNYTTSIFILTNAHGENEKQQISIPIQTSSLRSVGGFYTVSKTFDEVIAKIRQHVFETQCI